MSRAQTPCSPDNILPQHPHNYSSASPNTENTPIINTTDHKNFQNTILNLTERIISALTSGKSLTRVNKQKIFEYIKSIQTTTTTYQLPSTSTAKTPSIPDNQINIITQTISTEFSKLHTCINKHLTKTPSQSPSQSPSYISYTDTYAKKPITKHSYKHSLIATHTSEPQENSNIIHSWRNSISFRHLDYNPSAVKIISPNQVRVEFDTEHQRNETLTKINLSDQITAVPGRKLKPMIILKGISRDIKPEDLTDIITKQNPTIKSFCPTDPAQNIKFKFIRKNRKNHLYNAVFIVSPPIWREITNLEKIKIDHQRIHTEDFSPLLQCYKCLSFGHISKSCKINEINCSHCALPHELVNCPNKLDKTPTCINCSKHNQTFGTNLNSTHSATSTSCPRLQSAKARVAKDTDYGQPQYKLH